MDNLKKRVRRKRQQRQNQRRPLKVYGTAEECSKKPQSRQTEYRTFKGRLPPCISGPVGNRGKKYHQQESGENSRIQNSPDSSQEAGRFRQLTGVERS